MILLAVMTLLAANAAVVIQPVANMYSSPSTQADVVSQAILGSNVTVLENRSGWLKVRTPDQYDGWIASESLRLLNPGEALYASSGRLARVVSLFANLYQEPDVTKRRPLFSAPFESRLHVISEPAAENRRWIEVQLPGKGRAWIQRGDVSFAESRLDVAATVALARRFLGLPYLWGGTSTFGYDCSGFTQMLLRQRGVIIPRDSGPQMRWDGFTSVDKGALKAGDLLFFGSSREKITHTGMYVGRSEFINATTWGTPVVQISRLDDPHWAGLLVACRRLK